MLLVRRLTPFWRFQLAGWLAFWVAMAASRVGRYPVGYMIVSKAVLTIMGLAITSFLLRPLYRRVLAGDPSLSRTLLITGAASYACALLWTAGDNLSDIPIAAALLHRTVRFSSVSLVFNGTLYNAFALLAWSLFYVGAKHYNALRDERERSLRAEALAQEAKLQALQYQLNPHFLFNALNAVSTLVVDGRNADASRMLARIGDLLRASLQRSATGTVSLAEEIEILRRYLDIEHVRLGDRLRVEIDVSEDAWEARVPPMLLQPLVENAVRHAVAPSETGGRIHIVARRGANGAGDLLRVAVDDDGPGLAAVHESANGVGLRNTRERLAQLYGTAHRFHMEEVERGGLRVVVELPFRTVSP
jgi:sensor histidine kinase YesM